MRTNLHSVILATALLLTSASYAQTTLYGITNANTIFTMNNVTTPSIINGPYTVSGVTGGQTLVALGTRQGNGGLYALGYDSVTGTAQLYRIAGSGTSYTANAVGTATTGISFGATNNAAMDFIPTMDNEIRVMGRNGNNYIMNADNGTVMTTGTAMSYATGDIHTGDANALAATAYTNSFYGSDATQEVAYDATNNILVMFDAGSFANGFNNAGYSIHSAGIGTGTIFMPGTSVGMDTWYDTTTHNNILYMSATSPLGIHLYKYDLSGGTGLLTDVGAIGGGTMAVRDIAFAGTRDSTTALTGHLMTGLSLNLRNLVFFDAMQPGIIRQVRPVSGITTGQRLIAIDYSMATGALFGLGYNSLAQTYQLYTIDSATGHATAVNTTPNNLFLGTDDGSTSRINAGFRFLPTIADRIRVIGNNGAVNVEIDANTGSVVALDTAATYVTGDMSFGASPNISTIGFTGYYGDAATQMFGFDANTGAMIMFDATNGTTGYGNGSSGYINTDITLNTVLSLFLHNSLYNNTSMDIMYDNTMGANFGYLASNYFGDSSNLQNYSVFYDMSAMLSGYHRGTVTSPSEVGTIGYGTPVKDVVVRTYAYPVTGIANYTAYAASGIYVYPNPVISNTHIVLPVGAYGSEGDVHAYIIDLNGNVIRSYQYAAGSHVLDVDMSKIPTGLYSVRVSGKGMDDYNIKVVKE